MAKKRTATSRMDTPQFPVETSATQPEIHCGRLRLKTSTGQISRDGQVLKLAPKQCQLLSMFMRHSGEVLPRSLLVREIWETTFMDDTRMLDVHVRWLREKIEDDPSKPAYLRTVRGVGYRFEPPSAAPES